MGILNFFSSKDPEDYEKKGNALFQAGAYGKAIADYERALEKLDKSSPWDDEYRQSLRDKIDSCKEQLARQHENTAMELMEAGHNDDARQYLELARELSRDDQLTAKIEQHLKQLDMPSLEAIQTTLPDFDIPDPAAVEPESETAAAEQDGDEHFTALIGTLPEEIQETYRNYPAAFKAGYLALNQGDFETAAENLAQALQESDDPQSYIPLELATACFNLGKYEEACRQAETFLQHHPDALPAYQLLCEIFWETKSFDRVEKLLGSLPDDLSESVAGYLLRGETLYHAGKYAEAKAFYRDFLKKYEWHESIARALAQTHEALGERTNARYLYAEIMDQCRSCNARVDPDLKQKYADLSFDSGHNTTEVLELYLSLAQELPENAADYYQKISRIYAAQDNEVEAHRFQIISQKYEKKE